MKRNTVLLCLLLCFFSGLLFFPRQGTGAEDAVPEGWTGIYDREDLEGIASDLSGKYLLMGDIDLTGSDWVPLGNREIPFSGILDGNGHTVYGLKVSDDLYPSGLIAYLCGGTVRRLTVSGSAEGPVAGLLAGKICHGAVTECAAEGTVTSAFFGGGIAGQIYGEEVTVADCVSRVTLAGAGAESSELMLGGIVGSVTGANNSLTRCTFSGSLAPSGPDLSVGGIAGLAEGTVSLLQCESTGALTLSFTDTAYAGGIVGRMGTGNVTVSRCSFRGDWAGSGCGGALYLGGIAGRMSGTYHSSIVQCTAAGSLTGTGHPNFTASSDGYRCTVCSAPSDGAGDTAYVGGIAGASVAEGEQALISQCTSLVSLQGNGSPLMLGGIVGMNRADTGSASVEDCLFAGRLADATPVYRENASCAGGIAGFSGGNGSSLLRRCVSLGDVLVDYPLADGAVAGTVSGYYGDSIAPGDAFRADVSFCYFRAGSRDSYAIPLTGAALSDPASYESFDFLSVWQMDEASGLPCLRSAVAKTPAPVPGDVDGNGAVTEADGKLLALYLSGNGPLTDPQKLRADLDGDGSLSARDLTLLLRSLS